MYQMKCLVAMEWNVFRKLQLKTEIQMVDKSVLKRLVAIWNLCGVSENLNSNLLNVGRYCDCESKC
jgi:hypothetical protein